jgi:nucleoside-diphosphate-sugar epimerase
MVTVAVTGIGGLLGRRVAAELEASSEIDRVVGLDIAQPADLYGSKLTFTQADIRDPDLARHLQGIDVVIHLAFQMDPIQDESRMRAINVGGTRNVFESAVAAGVGKVVYTSSGVAYGAHPDNDFPLTEDSPLRANPGFNYAEHKWEVEQWLWPWLDQHPELTTTVLRPSTVAGPGVQNFITRFMEAPRIPVVKGHRPPMQFAHVDDVAAAIVHAATSDLPGAYNVTSEGWLSFDEIAALSGRKLLELPEEVMFAMAEQTWTLGIAEMPPGGVNYWMHPWVMSVDKLVETGWRPKHSNRDALTEMIAEHADWLSFGHRRVRRSRVRAAAGALGAVAGLLLLRALRRR